MKYIFKNKKDGKLYTIEYLKIDLRFLNGNAFKGIYATPYKWKGKTISYTKQDHKDGKINEFNPEKFVDDNFITICEF